MRVGYGGSGRVAASRVDSSELLYLHIWFVEYLDGDMKIIKNFEKYDKGFGFPVDVALDKKGERVEESIDILNKNQHPDLPVLDIWLETILKFSREIRNAGTVIMNGPAGVFEREAFTLGTVELIEAAAKSGFSVVGGGHSAAAVEQLGVESRIDHISTGGGACIDFLAGEKLPGIEALKESAVRYRVK